jgi:hypothetical protein
MGVEFIEIEIAQVVVRNVLRKHVVDRDQDLVSDRYRSSFVSTSRFEAVELVPQIGSFGTSGGAGASTKAVFR